MVAVGIPGAVLHMADQSVLPVHHVKRTIGGEFQVGRSEVQVFGYEQVLAVLSREARVLVDHLVLFDTEEADVVVDQDAALHFIGKVPA